MSGPNRRGWRLSARVASRQGAVAALLASVLLWQATPLAAWSALLGGFVGVCATLTMAGWLFAADAERQPRRLVYRLYVAEALKLIVTALLFVAVLTSMQVNVWAMLLAFGLTLPVLWSAAALLPGLEERRA